ncbi:fibronectin type III domain-containing protein [Flexithrix dorotheae]|uniref:fibronectin type III domain-containing protein n=1 Tax=Flexithrix dorotheae TaxID=70993 RepID=UPI0003A47694|nr:fibronectin type III domain-containing protein [Flexithrix dorotheae]
MVLSQVLDPNDPIVEYDEVNPPAQPPYGQIGKWVITPGVNWNSDQWKSYIYKGVPFRLRFPNNYDPSRAEEYPMIFILHGYGFKDGTIYLNDRHLNNAGADAFEKAINNGKYDGFVIAPQAISKFSLPIFQALSELVTKFDNELHLDINRVSLNGRSGGAVSVWDFIAEHPKLFSSALPISGISPGSASKIGDYKFTPIWVFQGEKDKGPYPYQTEALVSQVEAAGGDITYKLYLGKGHGIMSTVYAENDFFPYMLESNKVNPWVLYGQHEFCPGDPVDITVGVTPGFDGYEWRKDGVLLTGETENTIQVTEYGVYDVRIKRGNEWSYWSPKPMVVGEKATTVTPPITVREGMSNVLPSADGSTSVTLELPEGYESYEWQKVGNGTVLGTSSTLVVSEPGEYIARVTEKFGCSSNFSTPFKVVDASGTGAPDELNGLVAYAISKTEIQLNWSDNPNATYNETGFEIYRSLEAGTGYTLVHVTGADELSFLDTELSPNTEYFYILRPINEEGAAPVSVEVSTQTQVDSEDPTAPRDLYAESVSSTQVTLKWKASSDNVGVYKYDVYQNGQKALVVDDTEVTVYNLIAGKAYNFSVVARDVTGNESAQSNQVVIAALDPYLNYKYYEGTWSVLPDFNTLTPVKTGTTANVDLGLRDINSYYAFMWEGFINIPVAGTYTFETRSDDGSKLYIGNYDEANLVVNNDGTHSSRYREGTYNFTSPGDYPIVMTYFQGGGSGRRMEVYWKNTAHGVTSRQLIPDNAFRAGFDFPDDPPATPTEIGATAVSYDQIDLTWLDNSDNETGFQIYRSTSLEGSYYSAGTVEADATSFNDSGLDASTTYYYKVQSLNDYGVSAFQPFLPSAKMQLRFENDFSNDTDNGLNAMPAGNPVFNTNDVKEGIASLTFDGSDDWFSLGSGSGEFHDEFTERTVAFWMKPASITGKKVIYDEGGTTNGFAIRLENSQIELAVRDGSNQKTIGSTVALDTWVHVAAVFSNGRLSLYLDGEEKAVDPNTGYSDVSAHSNEAGLGATNGSSNAFGDNGSFYQGLMDDLRVYRKALSIEEIQKLASGENEVKPYATTLLLPPAPMNPANFTATAISSTAISLTWGDLSDNETGFEIYRSVGNSNNYILQETLDANTTSYNEEGLFANVTYFYKVVAFNVGGSSDPQEASIKTLNNEPILSDIGNQTMRHSTELFVNLFGEDEDGDNLTYSVNGLPSFGELTDYGDGSALLLFSPVAADNGNYPNIEVVLSDGFGGVKSEIFSLEVGDNYVPEITPLSNISISENDSIEIHLSATDQNGVSDLVWTVTGLPSFGIMNSDINTGTAILSFAPGLSDVGSYPIQVSVTDPDGAVDTETFTLVVEDITVGLEIYVNLNGPSYDESTPWNNTHGDPSNGSTFGPFIDASGGTTTVEMRTSDFGVNTLGSTSTSGIYPSNVMQTSYWSSRTSESFTLTGLPTNYEYELIFFGSRDEGGLTNRTTDYTVNGQTVSLNASKNSTETVSLSGLTADASGEITVTVSKGYGSAYSYLNALIVKGSLDDGTLPAAPKDLSAALAAGPSIALSWLDVAYNEQGYEVWRSTVENGTYELLNPGATAADVSAYVDGTVSGSTTYFYKVRSVNQYGESEFSGTVSVETPNAPPLISPIGIVGVKSGEILQLSVSATDSDPGDIVTLSTEGLPGFATFEDQGSGNGMFTLSPQVGDEGNYIISLTAVDENGGSAHQNIEIVVVEAGIATTYINFTKDSPEGFPWNNTQAIPNANLSISNLLDDSGSDTGVGLTLLDGWTGYDDIAGMGTGDESGIYPDNVMKSYYWDNSTNIKRIKMSGLSNTHKYNFIFFASRNGGGDRTTNYSIGGETVSLNAAYNSANTVQINGISPDSVGEVLINVQKASTASYGYINALIIQAYEDDGLPFMPSDLIAKTLSKSALELNWEDNSDNETGFEIWKSNTLNGNYNMVATVGVDVTSFTDSLLETGSAHYYKVRAINAIGESDFSNISEGRTLVFAVYMNFNETDPAAEPWNNTSAFPLVGDYYADLKNDEGNPTGINLEVTSNFDGVNPYGMITGDDSGIVPDNVMRSSYWLDYGNTGQLTLSGLSSFFEYNLVFFGSRNGGGDRTTVYTVGTESVSLNASYNTQNTAVLNGISPNGNGEITIDIDLGPNASFAYINGLVIQAVEKNAGNLRKSSQSLSEDNGINNITDIVDIYPNPFLNTLNLDFEIVTDEMVDITLRDLSGRTIYSRKGMQINAGKSTMLLDFSNEVVSFSSGLYLLEVNGVTVGKNIFKVIKR